MMHSLSPSKETDNSNRRISEAPRKNSRIPVHPFRLKSDSRWYEGIVVSGLLHQQDEQARSLLEEA